MSDSYLLDEFLYAVKSSIYKANQKAWRQHLANLSRYFMIKDKVMEPRMLSMMLPSTEVEGDSPEVEKTDVPIANLVEHTPLTMATLSVEFECYLEGLGAEDSKGEYQSVVLNMSDDKKQLPKAKFTIEYHTNEEPPEGIARINDALLKHF